MKIHYFIIFALLNVSTNSFAFDTPEILLKSLGISLPKVTSPIGNYAHAVRDGNYLYFTGKGPSLTAGGYMKGKLGKDFSIEQGQEASRLTVINLLSVIKAEIGDLSKIEKIIKVTGMVNSVDSFDEHPKVIDGASDLLTKVFGDKIGKHTRSVFGVNSLPMGIPVEIDMIVKIKRGVTK
ncbi:MAG: RidA family protein [Bacteriovoracaceae bacterium]